MTAKSGPSGLTYADAGVDIDAGNALVKRIAPLARATARPGADGALGGFGALFDPKAAGFEDPVLVSATDGVGTKLKLAFETGHHTTVGIDLVAMCVNDLIVQGAEPLFFLDYFACGRLDVDTAASVVEGIAEGCRRAGCALIGGETAEMPGLYADGHYDLAGFAVGAAERGTLLPRADVGPDDVLISLASTGLHSNGFSLVRKVIEKAGLALDDEAPFAKGQSLGAALLEPTRIYAGPLLTAIREGKIKALAHITGGGLTENLPRVLPQGTDAVMARTNRPRPAVFDWLQETGAITEAEMQRTFNNGTGMVLVVSSATATELSENPAFADWAPRPIGTLAKNKAKTARVVFE